MCLMAMFMACTCHKHTFAKKWTYDEIGHWHKATCKHKDNKSAFSEHVFDGGVETAEGTTKFTCICGYAYENPSRYRVTAEEYASVLGAVEKFRVDRNHDDGSHTYSIISDVVFLASSGVSEYYGFKGADLAYLVKNYDQEEYIEKEKSKIEYDSIKTNNNLLGYIADKFALLTYNLETGTYDAESLLIEEQGERWARFNDLSVSFEDGKLVSVKFVFAIKDWGYYETGYMYSEIGTASTQLPVTWHKHTYYEAWTSGKYYHWHASICGHNYAMKDNDSHTFNEYGVCTVCGYSALTLSEDGTTVIELKNDSIKSITIPEGVTTIGGKAFYECWELTNIVFPTSLTSIGDNAFRSCSNLTEVILPEGLSEVGDYVFAYCSNLKTVTLPSTLTKINGFMFYSCAKLTTVNMAEGIKEIDYRSFAYCTSLTEIVLPKSLTVLNSNVFSNIPITKIYYKGNETEWSNLDKASGNIRLNNATTLYYYSETQPQVEGNFWHYVDEVPTVW